MRTVDLRIDCEQKEGTNKGAQTIESRWCMLHSIYALHVSITHKMASHYSKAISAKITPSKPYMKIS